MRVNHTPIFLLACFISFSLFTPKAEAGPAKCFMHGIITPTGENTEKSSLSDMIRLHFDANEKAKCEQMMSAYCQYNVKNKNYSPARLKGTFMPDTEKSEEYSYTYSDKCKVQTDD